MKIAFVLYDQFTALDLVGPYEVIARWPGAEVHFVAAGPGPVRADAGLVVLPTGTLVGVADAPASLFSVRVGSLSGSA
jgi:putative intracellular protease/amidase